MKLLIVGGVAGGASAAARSRRLSEDAQIVIFERGPDVSFANCGLPYHVGGEIAERKKLLVTTPEMLKSRFKLDVRIRSSVEAIDRTVRFGSRFVRDSRRNQHHYHGGTGRGCSRGDCDGAGRVLGSEDGCRTFRIRTGQGRT